ncbi:hypothetical protein P7M41_25560 [Vibrio parahaemolyticus]|uniref:hypothetical protein n=1 Tax=Vibrio harveyi group TaxID=717610 RepID=UPI000EA2AB15|nr:MULTISPECIES: hypothetical protein [Vibrio harveyi group]AYF15591.1 hypothetical protein FORC72_1860 [Vibrio parahaemolyticus]EGQ7821104.1 hypothetical protein [Vibrio parahaemolyticus]EGR3462028.1 hypothetical protein [Vibrio parahaemolyticus]EJC7187349.1 hypothetical protein [Vibrio parahaemolyticus]EJE8516568.1 hypothetical protein [Vibrio parahaemolyticus]
MVENEIDKSDKEKSISDSTITNPKQNDSSSTPGFLKREVAIYISQIFLFFWITFLLSECLTSEEKLLEHIDGIISDDLIITMLYTVIASIITLGFIEFIAKGLSEVSFLKLVSDDVALSIGRAMYTLGSSITGACLATGIFSLIHYNTDLAVKYFWVSLGIGFVMFLYGYFISYWCNRSRIS